MLNRLTCFASLRVAAIALAAFATGVPANAALLTVTWNGTIGAGTQSDTLGLFGSAGANLAGAAFTAVVTFDNSNPAYNTPYTGATSGTTSQYFANTNSFLPPNSASFSVNGITVNFSSGLSCDNITQSVTANGGSFDLHTAAGVGCNTQNFYLDVIGPNINPDYTADTNITVDSSYTSSSGGFTFRTASNGSDNLSLTPSSLTTVVSSQTQAVPEPASLALFGAGLSMLGLLRRRRG